MKQINNISEMLDLMPFPVFCAENHAITKVNHAAAKLFLRVGLPLDPLFESGCEEYATFEGGMLYVTLSIIGQNRGASVVRIGSEDIFTLDQEFESDELRILALAARELRGPLANAMLATQQLAEADRNRGETSRLNRGLYQMLRIITNMSDASGSSSPFRPEMRNANAMFQEIVEKAAATAALSGITIYYSGLCEDVCCPMDSQQLERALLNMLSNAIKFSSDGNTVTVTLSNTGNILRLSVTDEGPGISPDFQGTLFRQYLREPVIEDGRRGIGLGMLLIRNAAASHGGAVLVDHPAGKGTRISITISTKLSLEPALHTRGLNADYAGEQDHVLLELSELLPSELF